MSALAYGLLGGALTKYLADEDASDKLKGNIIDAVSNKVYGVDIPNAEKEIADITKVKNVFSNTSERLARFADAKGMLESGDIRIANDELNKYIATTKDNKDSFIKKLESMDDNTFEKFIGSSLLDIRSQNLKDKKEHINSLFSDRKSINDLLVSPTQKDSFLFGDRVTPGESIAARGRLESEVSIGQPQLSQQESTTSLFDIKTQDDDFTKGFMFSPAAVDIGTPKQITDAAVQYRGFGEGIQRDSVGNITGMKFGGNKQTEYNAFTAVMNDLGSLYKAPSGRVNLTALAEAANDQLTKQTQSVMATEVFKDYRQTTIQEKVGAQKADIMYTASGFNDSFNERYSTDKLKIEALVQYMSTLGTRSEQLYFAQSIPSVNGSFELRNTLIRAVN